MEKMGVLMTILMMMTTMEHLSVTVHGQTTQITYDYNETTQITYNYTALGIQMRIAARAGDAGFIQMALDVGTPVDGTDISGYTALLWAAFFGRDSVVEVLLNASANVNHQNQFGETPLILSTASASNMSLQVTNTLLDNDADPDLTDIFGISSLMVAAGKNDVAMIDTLVEANADINQRNYLGNTALLSAAETGAMEAIDKLLDEGAPINDTNDTGFTALMWGARFGHTEVVTKFLDAGLDIDQQNIFGDTALMWSALGSSEDVTELLLERGADPDITSTDTNATALMGAAVVGAVGVAEALIEAGADTTNFAGDGTSALTLAIVGNNPEIIKLLADDVSINQQNLNGTTPLHIAVLNNLTDVVPLLLETCPGYSLKDENNRTVLELSEALGHAIITDLLLGYVHASCTQLERTFGVGEVTYQNCEKLLCHCTGRWRLVTGRDPRCDKAASQFLVNQRINH